MKSPRLVKILIFVLPSKNRLVVSFWIFFQISWQPQRIRKCRNHQKCCWCKGYLSKV